MTILNFNHKNQILLTILNFNHKNQILLTILNFNHKNQILLTILNFNHKNQILLTILNFNHKNQILLTILNFNHKNSKIGSYLLSAIMRRPTPPRPSSLPGPWGGPPPHPRRVGGFRGCWGWGKSSGRPQERAGEGFRPTVAGASCRSSGGTRPETQTSQRFGPQRKCSAPGRWKWSPAGWKTCQEIKIPQQTLMCTLSVKVL